MQSRLPIASPGRSCPGCQYPERAPTQGNGDLLIMISPVLKYEASAVTSADIRRIVEQKEIFVTAVVATAAVTKYFPTCILR